MTTVTHVKKRRAVFDVLPEFRTGFLIWCNTMPPSANPTSDKNFAQKLTEHIRANKVGADVLAPLIESGAIEVA